MEAKVQALPLFPLNVVLFPGQTLPLHIFEPRYRVMIKQCVDNNEPFGVVLAYEPDTPVEVGTTARITEVKRLPDGKMDITTVGEERFKIHNLRQSEHGYLIGDVTLQPFTGVPEKLRVNELTRLTRRYLKLLSDAMGMRFRFEHFPTNANDLALFAAIALRLPLDEKQELLDQDSLSGLIESEVELLRAENRQMSVAVAAVRPPEDEHGFCLN
jgi:Lon protease-like protein